MYNFDGRYSDVHVIALTGVRGKRKKKKEDKAMICATSTGDTPTCT